MHACAQALLAKHSNLADLLALFFRDDVVAWMQRRAQRGAGNVRTALLKQLVDANVDACMRRMAEVAPTQPAEVCARVPLPLHACLSLAIMMHAQQDSAQPQWSLCSHGGSYARIAA